jgi:metal-sulfur cluster biosynthetic enzyme
MIPQDDVLETLRGVLDPELGINVVDLGLVYGVEIEAAALRVKMTMTTPTCPLGAHLCESAESLLHDRFPEIPEVHVELVWTPAWNQRMMSAAARRQLGWTE